MNLLPKSHEEFSEKDYWDTFFKKRGSKAFEWYGEYPELAEQLHKYIKPQDHILITGCGNSTVGRDLYDIGYRNITNIDISHIVIKQMLSQHEKDRPNLKYLQMDALDTSFNNEGFNVILDKGTLDALMPSETPEITAKILKYFNEIHRILKPAGRYLCISLLQEHILRALLHSFSSNWMFRVIRCFEVEAKAVENDENSLPVFLVICTKFANLPRKILEYNLTSGDKMQRTDKCEDILAQIKSVQQAAFICSSLKRSKIEENEVALDLFSSGSDSPRFTVHVVDGKFHFKNMEYAAFIVPQGREAEWLFSTKQGRQHLVSLTKTNRLAIVTLHRRENFGTFEEVQVELGDTICSLAPSSMKKKKISFLSLGGTDLGTRIIKHEGNSTISGNYVVEDVVINGEKFRRLYYLKSQLVIQSEAKLKKIKTRKGNKEVIDFAYLSCRHHVYMSVATHIVCSKSRENNVLIVGLGGGGLCSFLGKLLPKIKMHAVDIDPEMLKVALEFFGLRLNDHLSVVIKDGVQYIKEIAKQDKKFSSVLFDVDSKDTSIGMSCPPKEFLEENVLDDVIQILEDTGAFVLNLVLRDTKLRSTIITNLTKKFKTIVSYRLADDLNEILLCTVSKNKSESMLEALKISVLEINSFFKKQNSSNVIDLDEFLKEITIL